MGNLGSPEIVVLAIVFFLFFGAKKLKDLAKGLGESAKEIKNIQKDMEENKDGD